MRAGELRHRIQIDRPESMQNDTGEEVTEYVPAATVWGSIEPLRGRERALAGTDITATMDTRIKVRWSPFIDGINAEWRLRHQDIIYNIESIAHIEMRHREIEIMAYSGINKG